MEERQGKEGIRRGGGLSPKVGRELAPDFDSGFGGIEAVD